MPGDFTRDNEVLRSINPLLPVVPYHPMPLGAEPQTVAPAPRQSVIDWAKNNKILVLTLMLLMVLLVVVIVRRKKQRTAKIMFEEDSEE